MKFTPLALASSLLLSLVCAPSFALNEVTRIWYPAPIHGSLFNNGIVAETTVGCIDKDVMYIKHSFKANSSDDTWQLPGDYIYRFVLLSDQPNAQLPALNAFPTSRLHNSNGSTLDARGNDMEWTSYHITRYVPITSVNHAIMSFPHFTRQSLDIDPQCDFI